MLKYQSLSDADSTKDAFLEVYRDFPEQIFSDTCIRLLRSLGGNFQRFCRQLKKVFMIFHKKLAIFQKISRGLLSTTQVSDALVVSVSFVLFSFLSLSSFSVKLWTRNSNGSSGLCFTIPSVNP